MPMACATASNASSTKSSITAGSQRATKRRHAIFSRWSCSPPLWSGCETWSKCQQDLVRKLEAKYERITFCYEAGPTGYELQRHIHGLGHECMVAAPSLIPKKPGDRVKTNRRDAVSLVKLLRAGELTAVWDPDRRHEAM